ncbi:MAG: polysaccharide deacetylase family protein [Magnetococcales bacterium]|nr:polysaccharide deacetylase family protein [Magnetococcales bacterium]
MKEESVQTRSDEERLPALPSRLPLYECFRSRGIVLTIDDGPSPESTLAILDLLERHQAQAAFFVIGANARAHPELVAAMVAGGHGVYSHGFAHRKFKYLKDHEILEELTATEALLSCHRPVPRPYYLRLPYGNGQDDDRVHAVVAGWNPEAVFVSWTSTPREWNFSSVALADLQQECRSAAVGVCETIRPGSILLMHDWITDPYPGEKRNPLRSKVPLNLLGALLEGLRAAGKPLLPMAPGAVRAPLPLFSAQGLLKAAEQFQQVGMTEETRECRARAEGRNTAAAWVDPRYPDLLKGWRVEWESDVLASWRRTAGGAPVAGKSIWERLPAGVQWFSYRLDTRDMENLHVFGTGDWLMFAGQQSHRLSAIAAGIGAGEDALQHHSRINGFRRAIGMGERYEPLILIGASEQGPFMILDGNHRAIAMWQLGALAGQAVFLGVHPRMSEELEWFRNVINHTPAQGQGRG